ncbi:MAG: cobyrinate a,c-diamide synthase, partial [Ruminiclostridium sp.]|nr:cobyrinate a,c-diamide synthase [Ruminiclostridium sp.]
MKRIIIAGTHSGCGKTTVTCAVLAALKARGLSVSAFKCGPDYIDPMFHREVIGVPSRNLDSFFCGDDTLRYLLAENGADCGIAVIEGVMGFYDGADGRGSAYSVSQITDTPAVIVIDCRGMSESIGAVMRGFLEHNHPSGIAGFIFNRLPERLV